MSSKPTHFEIYGDKPEELAAFYGELFGWRLEQVEGLDYWRIYFDPSDMSKVAGGVTHRPRSNSNCWLQFVNVESIDESIAFAEKRGAKVIRPKTAVPRTAWVAVLADPAGNHFAVWQPDRNAFPTPDPD